MFRTFVCLVGFALSGCASVRDTNSRILRWSLDEDVAFFERFDRNGPGAGLIYAPLRSAGSTLRYASLMRDVAARIESCDRFLLLQEIWEGGAQFSGGWLCRSTSGVTTAIRFGIDEDNQVIVQVVAKIGSGDLQSSIELLAREKEINTDRYTTMDGVAAVVTFSDRGLARRSFYAPVSIDLNAIAELDPTAYEGFDRFYVAMNRVLEGACSRKCF